VSKFTVKGDDLPSSFDGFKIAQVSDFHSEEFGKDNVRLLNKLRASKPDIIAFTGDTLDSYDVNYDISLNFIKEALKIAPCYFVMGNHEGRLEGYESFKNQIIDMGVVVLENTSCQIERNGEKITLYGLLDPESLKGEEYGYGEMGILEKLLRELDYKDEGYGILLSHRPECFDYYVDYKFDLVLTGHTHGGQFRLPIIGAVYAPNQGFFPKYSSGMHTSGETTMIVSRGLGNSSIPLRFNNTPELVLITLEK
jgi:predicted MPP superfamily phosphohydrolase